MPVLVINSLVNRVRFLSFIFLLCVLTAHAWAAGITNHELSDYYGVWKGSIVEGSAFGNSHERYDVIVEIVPGRYTIDYPSLKCGGKLRFQGRNGRHFHFRDELEYGKDQCVSGGYTELQMVSTTLAAFQWFDSNGVLRAKGLIKRNKHTFAL